MPYIDNEARKKFDITTLQLTTAGELNYVISELCSQYLAQKGLNYTHCNEIIGVVECVKQEFYRKVTAPHEEQKIKENGDISYKKI